jgi:hypothetical protein
VVDGSDDGVGKVEGQDSTETYSDESGLLFRSLPVGSDFVNELIGRGADGVNDILAGFLNLVVAESADNRDAAGSTYLKRRREE